jgi:hypothetical protein
MTNCFVIGAYGPGIWTTENAADCVFRNNVITNANYVWTYQSGALAQRDPDAAKGGEKAPEKKAVHYKVADSLVAGNKKRACSGTGAYLGFKEIDAAFLELETTKVTDHARSRRRRARKTTCTRSPGRPGSKSVSACSCNRPTEGRRNCD